ncbi:MAG: hypothetical protein GY862_37710 [Gammaproteobacteria bacterium]|nr:hypothetical protein [Gammaproteobacteria bacterium]
MIGLLGVLLVLGFSNAAYSADLNQYEHMPGSARLPLNKYRAFRYILPELVYETAMDQLLGQTSGAGINIGNILPGAQPPREMNIIIDGDVISYTGMKSKE